MAVGLAAELKESVSATVELIESSGGKFEVVVDGDLVFSKKELNRFPALGEVSKIVQKKISES